MLRVPFGPTMTPLIHFFPGASRGHPRQDFPYVYGGQGGRLAGIFRGRHVLSTNSTFRVGCQRNLFQSPCPITFSVLARTSGAMDPTGGVSKEDSRRSDQEQQADEPQSAHRDCAA
jgi:hypothetical protein